MLLYLENECNVIKDDTNKEHVTIVKMVNIKVT